MRTTHAAEAWCKGFTGKGVVVAVLDTGIDPDNPDLRPNLDVKRSISFVDSEPTFVDFNGHGSHTAGIVAAARNNFGVTGIAPEATLIAVKVLDQRDVGTVFGVLQGMVYAADKGADLLSMSLRTITPTFVPGLRNLYGRAVRYVGQRGGIVVAAIGNESLNLDTFPGVVLPAEIKPVIAVSAVGPEGQEHFDNFAFYSNFGQAVDVAAPGGNLTLDENTQTILFEKRDFVLSTFSTHITPRTEGAFSFQPAPHAFWLGTSMATPHVAGAVAVLRHAFPKATPDEIRRRLFQAADDLGTPGKDPFFGHGRLNVGRAVAGAKGEKDASRRR